MDFTIESSKNTHDYTLTAGQEEALAMMKQLNNIFILESPAGCGKSVLINRFVGEMANSGKHIVLCAPTHKSLSIIDGDATIHSYLNLKLKWKKDKQVLEKAGFADNIRYGDVLVIDEASMLNEEIVDYILQEQESNGLKIIFVGSIDQIQPINEKVSPVWELQAPTYTLKEIVRQAKGSGIISLATSVRTGITHPGDDVSKFVNNKDVFSGSVTDMKKFFCDCLNEGEDSIPTIISYRNKIVNSANVWARSIVKNDPKDLFLVGEKVYIRSTSSDQEHNLEDIVKILDISKKIKYNDLCDENELKKVKHDFYVFEIRVASYKGLDDLVIPASERDEGIIKTNKSSLAKLAREKKINWKDFWDFSESLSEIKHVYALTAHRSQGSTYKNVIINYNDISDKSILYTAITRAAEKLFLLV